MERRSALESVKRIRGNSGRHPLIPDNFEIIIEDGPEDPQGLTFLLNSIEKDQR